MALSRWTVFREFVSIYGVYVYGPSIYFIYVNTKRLSLMCIHSPTADYIIGKHFSIYSMNNYEIYDVYAMERLKRNIQF